MLASPRQPGGDGRLSKAEDPRSRGRVEPFGQRREHHGDLVRGSFQPVQGGVVPGSERGATRLTPKGLDRLSTAMLAVPDQRVDASVCLAKVRALPVGTGEAFGVDAFGGSSAAF